MGEMSVRRRQPVRGRLTSRAIQSWGRHPAGFKARQADEDATSRNRVGMLAWTLYRRGLRPHSGYPRDVCRSEERAEAQRKYCFAEAAVAQAERYSRGKDGATEPGLLHVPVYQSPVEI
ncbi:hypothetical protein [Nesterenkonia suensis]